VAVPAGEADRQDPVRLIEDGFVCAQACAAAAAACLQPAAALEPDAWNRLDVRCAETCEMTAHMLTQYARHDISGIRAQVELCAVTCQSAAQGFELLARTDERAAAQARACKRCERACHDLLLTLER
jgi:hypothetical protein